LPSDLQTRKDSLFLEEALSLARIAKEEGEVPVGALVVLEGEVVGRGWNQKEKRKSPLAHAEIIAIESACNRIGQWRLEECTLYSTLEPCLMCAGAILGARIPRLVFLLPDPKFGAVTSRLKVFELGWNHIPEVFLHDDPVLRETALSLMRGFFQELRKGKGIHTTSFSAHNSPAREKNG